ncbi:MAG: hypothetical protein MRERV_42c009 [Mycoplasmataceae bacterium RV_VA103A]|nr:MAG: hypothetical protein MRERV_42c009 [Mycoplasmataceae bacterium RV_VA103A]
MSQTKKCVQCDQLISPQRMKDGPGVKTCSRLCFQAWKREYWRLYQKRRHQEDGSLFRKHKHQHEERCAFCVRIICQSESDEKIRKIMKANPGCHFCLQCIERPEAVKHYEENEWVYM